MGGVRLFRPSLILGLGLLAMLADVPQADAQERAKVEIVPNLLHSGSVLSVAFSPDGARVLSGGSDRTLKLWDAATGRLIRTFEGRVDISSVAFSPDGKRLASGGFNGANLWDAATGHMQRVLEEDSWRPIDSIAFSPDGAQVLWASDKTLKLYNIETGRVIRTFKGHTAAVTSVAFSPDGARLLSGSEDKTLKLWDATNGRLLRSLRGHSDKVTSVAFSRDGARILSGSEDETLMLWDARTGRNLRTYKGHGESVASVAFSPDGARAVSASTFKLGVWNIGSGQLERLWDPEQQVLHSVAFAPDGARVVAGGGHNILKLWDPANGTLLHNLGSELPFVRSVRFSPKGTHILSNVLPWIEAYSTSRGDVRVWDAVTGQLLHTFGDERAGIFSSNGAEVITVGGTTASTWDVATGHLLRKLPHYYRTDFVALSPDGKLLASGDHFGLDLLNLVEGRRVKILYENSVTSIAFSPDGAHVLASTLDDDPVRLKLWNVVTGELVRTFEGQHTLAGLDGELLSYEIDSVAFSPDGAQILSGGRDGTLRLRDTASGNLLHTFEGHSGSVKSVAFSPDGSRVLSAGGDKTVKLWDPADGRLLTTFRGHLGELYSVVFSPDGLRAVSGGWDGTTRTWSLSTGKLLTSQLAGVDGEWLAITRDGFFSGSRRASGLIGIARANELTLVDQVHQSLFNPDLVRETLAGDPAGEVAEAAKVINLEKVLDSGPAPSVAITSPAEGSQSASDLATFTARIENRGKGIGRIEWRVNSITAAVATKPPGGGSTHTVTQQLALDPGDNVVEVVAYNASNLLASLPARTTVTFTGPADQTKPKLHILAIGIDAYVDKGWAPPGKAPLGFGPLGLAVKDATVFADSMKKAAAGLYDEVRVTLALDQDATRDNLHKIVDKIAAQIHPRDTFILFAAAHGKSEGGRFHLIPQDYQSGPPGTLAQRAIRQDDLQDWLANRIKARKALILLDTCESGALIAGHTRSRIDATIGEAGVGRLHEATGRPVLAAAAADQEAKEGRIGTTGERHGYFTYALLDALRHGDSNGNGLIELSELVAHVQTAVPRIATGKDIRGLAATSAAGKQSARFGSRGEDFAVARRLR